MPTIDPRTRPLYGPRKRVSCELAIVVEILLLRSVRIAFLGLAVASLPTSVAALGRDAQELSNIHKKIAPDQCQLRKLSAEDMAAKRAGDQGKRQELAARMVDTVKRIQGYQPRIQELSQSLEPTSADYQSIQQQTVDLRAKCTV
jgi:hypothetical protein